MVDSAQRRHHCEYHKRLAIRTLKHRLRTPAKLDEADGFSAVLVAYSAYMSDDETTVLAVALNLFLSVFGHLNEQSASTSVRIFPVLAPFLLEIVRFLTCYISGKLWFDYCLNQISRYRPSFRDWRTCTFELKRVSFRNRVELPTMSVLSTVEDLLQTGWTCLYGEVTKTFRKVQRLETAGEVCDDITQTLNHPDFQDMVNLLVDSESPENFGVSVDLVTYAAIGKEALNGLVVISQATTIATGLAAMQESSMPAALLQTCVDLSPVLCGHRLSQYIYRVALVLGACTISPSELLTCTFYFPCPKWG